VCGEATSGGNRRFRALEFGPWMRKN
jgi:hypothetical protein